MIKDNHRLQEKYKKTALVYDILDYPWERQYRKWRPQILKDVCGCVLEAGVGTGKNLPHYPEHVELTGVDLSPAMLSKAEVRCRNASCSVSLHQNDATQMNGLRDNQFDWFISTFMFCVMPDHLQASAIEQMVRVLKPGGKFRIIEMTYSKQPNLLWRQRLFAPFVEKLYGARFDRQTLTYLQQDQDVRIQSVKFLKEDTYLLIEGYKYGRDITRGVAT